MFRLLCAAVLLAPIAAKADLKKELESKYRQFDTALSQKNARATSAWVNANTTADFQYVSRDKNRFPRKAFEKGLRDQIAVTQRVLHAHTSVTGMRPIGSTVEVRTRSETEAIVTFDTKPLRLVDKSETVDTWVRSSGQWKLKKSVQVKADTQMYPK